MSSSYKTKVVSNLKVDGIAKKKKKKGKYIHAHVNYRYLLTINIHVLHIKC